MSNKENVIRSPFGTAKWISLYAPKVFGGGTPTPEEPGRYQVSLLLDPESDEYGSFVKECREVVDKLYSEYLEKTSDRKPKKLDGDVLPIVEDTDRDGDETGLMEVKTGVKAGGVRSDTKEAWSRKIPVFGLDGKPMTLEQEFAMGTKLRVSFEPSLWSPTGTSVLKATFRLRAAQVKEAQYRDAGGDSDFADMVVEEDFD